ncbi:UDP-2,4-diacetamido-2,4,6-trideoxy-beta-L-altropyranose hydrolase [Aneurinibacillus migulanus]|uniref:UDP-2,4-diacetamido-2,4,6-trideoxy-beta-L-altropyranose hydrolase n=1 Tax=Aneurinibacillus migulanus TaxID=47500 RepID=A0A0D1W1V3_ANEMI|nr:UDP-2,4-diacetamido-2,4,6-trideoxy-beta-L-altropyranose hydrolase [Aneurinibacillus migulanus]KIV52445.1 hypothetical protein TS65_23880 [Aneurinibacillus migulanus]KON94621.1 hypothetical protein AF333_03055 [Aneurinibacillus migulanus]MED0892671.1 UDP-2,4-diacetamido-2,4,6-trideoxy-beta-L-altropyranose hydrolase [Aneurinibacillus migulanus]MED1614312.1 UDP-2,4-diacetamido-2,4,6-trideoxy-beta-L-altropyranose hydrolase [Aneurinibacillus migulanus]SDI48270.1 UDP-2,4-diacetamido-2,4,6-trideox
MQVAFRVDASYSIGTGHVMRCLTLAHEIKERLDADVIFLCRTDPGNMCDYIAAQGYRVYPIRISQPLQQQVDARTVQDILVQISGVDWLIVDHYSLDATWERMIRISGEARHIFVIDDLANRSHDCEILLDQNYYDDMQIRYGGLVPATCKCLLGPSYALLRPQFKEVGEKVSRHAEQVRHVLLFFGGSDPTGETEKALCAWDMFLERVCKETEDCFFPFHVDVIVGASNSLQERIEEKCRVLNEKYPNHICRIMYYCQVENMADFMINADISLGAGGVTTWERCCVGLPSLVVAVADNQVEMAKAVDKVGAIRYLGWHEEVTADSMSDALYDMFSQPHQLRLFTEACARLMNNSEDNLSGVQGIIHGMKEVKL